MKRTRAGRRRAALLGWRTRVRGSKISASRTLIKRGERVRISWNAVGQSATVGKVDVSNRLSGYKDLYPKETTTYTLTARGYGQVSIRRVTVEVEEGETREYFVVVLFETRKHGKNFQRRLPEAILTLKDGATTDEIKEAYANWLLENTKWKAQDIHVLIWSNNQGRRVEHKIVPRDSPGSSEPAGTVRLNDTRQKWGPDGKERKGKARRGARGKKA